MAQELKKRSEVREQDTWNLSDLYKNLEEYEADIKFVEDLVYKIVALKGRLCESGKTLKEYFEITEVMNQKLERIAGYTMRLADQDTKNTDNQALRMKLMSLWTKLGEAIAFAEPELLEGLSAKKDQLYAEEPGLHAFDVSIYNLLRMKDHTLSPEMEKLLASAGEVLGGASNVFGMFDNADLVFPEITDDKGEKIRITHGRYRMLLENPDVRVRRDMFENYYKMYETYKNTLAANYQNLVKGHIFVSKARGYESSLERAVFGNDVPISVYKNLLDVVNKNVDKMHRYMSIRKKALKMDEQHMYDLFIPLVEDVDKKIPFEEAKEIVLDALKPMGEEYCAIIKRALSERWIDIYENEGKRSGAYSAGVYGVHPYVLLNYDDTLDAVFTLIHELGHAMHSYFSSEANSCVNSDYTIFVAEVASTCNEALLTQALLKKTTDKKERAYIINHMLDDFRTTLYRQTMFAEFEYKTHEMAEAGESLTADSLSKLYYDLNVKYYGDAVVSDPQIAYEWSRIPHFYYNFYVYQYATGYSAALALSNRILTEGQAAVDDYFKFLRGGCTLPPTELLKIAGVDMTKPESIQNALNIFENMMDAFEECLA
ncbi:MAG: oligoendopeptidase F [Lachnospiraceae bacterium]|nr:oligoendopeptidase F [Lachnospiraceae bacterium]